MATYTWTFDAATGTFKSHVLSEKLFEAAVAMSVFMDHVSVKPAFGKQRGETLTIIRIAEIAEPTSGKLSEVDRIPEDTYAMSTKGITIDDWGRAVPFTSFAQDLSSYNLENSVQRRLRDQQTLTYDTAAATAFKLTKIKYAATGLATNNITTNGTFGAASTVNMNVFHCEEIRDYMFDTLRVPHIDGNYVGIFRTLGLRGIKRDPDWQDWHKYTDPQAKYNSEVGRMEEIRFIECNHANALGKVGTGSVLGEGVVFGEEAVAYVEAMSPELRAKMPEDYGRSKGVAWYGLMNLDIIWDTGNAGEAKIVHVGST